MAKQGEPATLYPEPVHGEVLTGKGTHGYYRRPDNEWIMALPPFLGNDRDWQLKGFQRLIKYGEFANGTTGEKPNTRDENGNPWNPADEPWRQMFLRGGGKESGVPGVLQGSLRQPQPAGSVTDAEAALDLRDQRPAQVHPCRPSGSG